MKKKSMDELSDQHFQSMFIDWKSAPDNLIKVDRLNVIALKYLYENSYRMGSEGNLNVSVASVDPGVWLHGFIDVILDNVDYITKTTSFNFYTIQDKNLLTSVHSCDMIIFDTEEEIKNFICNQKFTLLVIFSIIKMVNLETLTAKWSLRYKLVENKNEVRNNKIDFLTDK